MYIAINSVNLNIVTNYSFKKVVKIPEFSNCLKMSSFKFLNQNNVVISYL